MRIVARSNARNRRQTGISRVELLVVLTIALVLGLITLSGVNRVRDASVAAQCKNNLRQFGIAVHGYDDAQGRLPPLTDQCNGAPTGDGIMSIIANLIPYVEAGPAYYYPKLSPPSYYHADSSIVFTYPHKDGSTTFTRDGGMANRVWRMFVDPGDATADRLRDVPMTLPDGTTGYYATWSYVASGLVPWGMGCMRDSFSDGTAHTVLFAERPQVCQTATGEKVYNLWGLGIYSPHMPAFAALTPTDPPGLLSTGQVSPVLPLPSGAAADRDDRIQVRTGTQDAVPCSPDFRTPVQKLRGAARCDARLPGSPHYFGMQVLMADCSVRVFAADTSAWLFWAACTPNGRETEP